MPPAPLLSGEKPIGGLVVLAVSATIEDGVQFLLRRREDGRKETGHEGIDSRSQQANDNDGDDDHADFLGGIRTFDILDEMVELSLHLQRE